MVDGREPADVYQKKESCHFDHPIQSYTQSGSPPSEYKNRHISTMAARNWMKKVSPGRVKRREQTAQKPRGAAEKRVRYDLKSSKVGRGVSPEQQRLEGSTQNAGRW
ncbi:hypothetical protein M404DRAFT_1003778 [Pisolithus tinctorius Marx 270]|uniref:Uncharacterized protein n=1 Tax=Pisolithus tinctorius Marx 270 TaxID=870435 RepID=A0A0C3NZF7_PISTI|nr:hypothetical protein M404DRAFT_1003778 [Pisolithus tinctorius Marx 270]